MNRKAQRSGLLQQTAGCFRKDRFRKTNRFGRALDKILPDIQKTISRDAVLDVKQFITDIGEQFDRRRQGSKSLPTGIIPGPVSVQQFLQVRGLEQQFTDQGLVSMR